MTKETNRREFVQVAGLAASGLRPSVRQPLPLRRVRHPEQWVHAFAN
jgi:hypothetical protein